MEDFSNSQIVLIIGALVASIYLLGRVIEVLAKGFWGRKFGKNGNCEKEKAQLKEVYNIVSRLDESGTPMVYSHIFQKEIVETQKEIVKTLAAISETNRNTSMLFQTMAENQKELYDILVVKKLRGT